MKSRIALSMLVMLVTAGCSGRDATEPTSRIPATAARQITSASLSSGDESHEQSSRLINFEKWFTTYPAMTGNTSYGEGTFAGKLLVRTQAGSIVHLRALYTVTDRKGRAFTADIAGDQDLSTNTAVLDGFVIAGRMIGSPVHVMFDVVTPCALATGPTLPGTCFRGTIRVGESDERGESDR